jgi:hypothetical protein
VALAACDDARPTTSAPPVPAASADFSNPSSIFQQEAEHHGEHAFERRAPQSAPSSVALPKEARVKLTSLHVSSAKDGVLMEKVGDVWQTQYTPRCLVDDAKLTAALNNLAVLSRSPTDQRIASGQAFVLRIVARSGRDKLLELDIGPRTKLGQLIQLADGTTYDVKGLELALFPAESRAWCRKP